MQNTPDEIIALMGAFKAGKRIQYRLDDQWRDCSGQPMFNFHGDYYRIAPEPKLRPWKPEEVPVGAVVRVKRAPEVKRLIVGYDGVRKWSYPIRVAFDDGVSGYHAESALLELDHSTDGGKTWKPCGVEE